MEDNSENKKAPQKLTLWQIISSVFAAAFGVQSNKNKERDFNQAKPTTYIIAGAIFTILFILVIVSVVSFVLSQATG